MWHPGRGSEKARKGGTWGTGPVLAVLLFALFTTAAFLTGPVAAVQTAEIQTVTRAAPATPAPGAEFEVTLQLQLSGELPLVVGIAETIPPGFSFISTSCEHYEISEQGLLLAVINESEVRYSVKAPASGAGTFSGRWIDMLSEREGAIADTFVSVGGTGTGPSEGGSPMPSGSSAAPSASSEVPGFETVFAVLSFLVAALLTILAVKGGRGA
jgi:hypothetical protein